MILKEQYSIFSTATSLKTIKDPLNKYWTIDSDEDKNEPRRKRYCELREATFVNFTRHVSEKFKPFWF